MHVMEHKLVRRSYGLVRGLQELPVIGLGAENRDSHMTSQS
jgi:hypothetical protein